MDLEISLETGIGSYVALNGSEVAIPGVPTLPDGPMPVFGDADMEWLSRLIAFRDRAVASDCAPGPDVDQDAMTGMPAAFRAMAAAHSAAADAMRKGFALSAEQARRRAEARFGADGRGFLEGLNSGELIPDFWANLRALLYQRIPILHYHAPEVHGILRDLLLRFPPRIWVPLIAHVCLPQLDHRDSDRLNDVMDRFLAAPWADLRHLETGAAKIERLEDLAPDTLRRALKDAFAGLSGYARFKTLTSGEAPDGDAAEIERSREMTELLRSGPPPDPTPERLELIRELFAEHEPARRHIDGVVQAESNLFQHAALNAALARVAPGRPEGYFMREALSTRPAGFTGIDLSLYPRGFVWPYIATHLDMVDRAMGLAAPLPVEPKFERTKAIALLRLLPQTPARYGDILLEVATGTAAGGRADAQALLAGAGQYAKDAVCLLESRGATAREQAARTLAQIGGRALPPRFATALRSSATSRSRARSSRRWAHSAHGTILWRSRQGIF